MPLSSVFATQNASAGPSSRPDDNHSTLASGATAPFKPTPDWVEGSDSYSSSSAAMRESQEGDEEGDIAPTWQSNLTFVRGKAREAFNHVRHRSGEASMAPEEGHATHISAAKQAAVNQMKARRRAMAWMSSGEDENEEKEESDGSLDLFKSSGQQQSERSKAAAKKEAKAKMKEGGEEEEEEEESAVSKAFLISYFIAGGAAGATSRTVVSPLERLKIIMQVQPKQAGGGTGSKGAYSGVWSGLGKMWHEEGFKGFMRGNGINCLRIAPYSAVQFSTYEILKNALKDDQGELDVPKRLTAGALAGIASVVSTYPLDLVRSRISIASASLYAEAKKSTMQASSTGADSTQLKPKKPSREEVRKAIEERQKKVPGIWAMTAKVYREEGGVRALYKGCVPTSVGVAPYVAINFAAYEALRKRLANEEGEISTLRKLSCGALAGSISQTLTYPLDVLRRRMQVSGMKNSKLGYSDKNSFAAIRTIVQAEGIFGLYRGITPNLLKVAPSIATSFCCYEFVCNLIHPVHHHTHTSNTSSSR